MRISARELGASTECPDGEDNEDENTDIVDEGREIKRLLEPFCTRGEKACQGGSYRWTCLLCATEQRPYLMSDQHILISEKNSD